MAPLTLCICMNRHGFNEPALDPWISFCSWPIYGSLTHMCFREPQLKYELSIVPTSQYEPMNHQMFLWTIKGSYERSVVPMNNRWFLWTINNSNYIRALFIIPYIINFSVNYLWFNDRYLVNWTIYKETIVHWTFYVFVKDLWFREQHFVALSI